MPLRKSRWLDILTCVGANAHLQVVQFQRNDSEIADLKERVDGFQVGRGEVGKLASPVLRHFHGSPRQVMRLPERHTCSTETSCGFWHFPSSSLAHHNCDTLSNLPIASFVARQWQLLENSISQRSKNTRKRACSQEKSNG